MPMFTARMLAVAMMKAMCTSSSRSRCAAVGKRFAPDQKGEPSSSLWSSGKLWMRLRMRSRKRSAKSSCASVMHFWKVAPSAALTIRRTLLRVLSASGTFLRRAAPVPTSARISSRKATGSLTYFIADVHGSMNRSVNCARAHSMQWSMSDGKLRSVHMGMASSSSPACGPSVYDAVRCGTMGIELHLVPSVPDSSSGSV
mmetsp:Transcript_2864/g.10129  ORF Transcript_2864/g.10129 Transcript_2864/m.10129 type:complete len:200 (-) Transcript_2864:2051-2650(-)